MNRETEREKPRNQSEQEGSQEEENGDGRGDGESLLNLVQPELSSLSKHWLAALKDHALLSLPPGKLHLRSEILFIVTFFLQKEA